MVRAAAVVAAFSLAAAASAAVPGLLQPNPPACDLSPLMTLEMPPWSMPVARAASPWESNRAIVLPEARSYCSADIARGCTPRDFLPVDCCWLDVDGFLLIALFPLAAAAPPDPELLQPKPPACVNVPLRHNEMLLLGMPVARVASI